MKKKTESVNYLDLIPKHREEIRAEISNDGKVTVFIENKGVFNTVAQKLFKKPRFTQVHLDRMGNFIWQAIDGKRSVYDIALLVKDEFKDGAEPLYDRLVQYMKTLESYEFITIIK